MVDGEIKLFWAAAIYKSAPSLNSRGVRVGVVSVGAIASSACAMILPLSIPVDMRKRVMPVTVSPMAMAYWTGLTFLYWGRREGWRL